MIKKHALKLLLVAIVAFSISPACKWYKDEPLVEYEVDWVYINETSHVIDYDNDHYSTNYKVEPNSSTTYRETVVLGTPTPPENFEYYIPIHVNTVLVGQENCSSTLGNTLQDFELYTSKVIDDFHYEFTFRFVDSQLTDLEKCRQ